MSEGRGPYYYDRLGYPATYEQWIEDWTPERKRVAETTVGQVWVSTVWLGLDHNWSPPGPNHRPLIFETMAFGPGSWSELICFRYATEEEALAGHEKAVALVRKRKHGMVKHERDERRAKMKSLVRVMGTPPSPLRDEVLAAMLLTYGRRRA